MENQFAHIQAESDVDRLAQITCEELAEFAELDQVVTMKQNWNELRAELNSF